MGSFTEALRLNPKEKPLAEALDKAVQKRKQSGQVPLGPPCNPSVPVPACSSTARISDNDFQRLSAAEMWKRVEAQAAQLSDEALDIELGRSGINAPLDKLDRAAKIRLFVGTPPKEKPFAKPSRAHKLLERRKRWVEEWQSWDDARLVKRLRKFGIDGEGCRKDALINQLLQVETER